MPEKGLKLNRMYKMKLLGSFLVMMFSISLSAQELPNVKAQFSNPKYDTELGLYSVDVELKTADAIEYLYGFNVRFFYDAELMEFQRFTDFADGYDLVGAAAPVAHRGNATSGRQLFALPGAAAYVNTGVQLVEGEEKALGLKEDQWSKVFRIEFQVFNFVDTDKDFCPSIIWDLEKPEKSKGSFLPNSDGVVFTVLDRTSTKPGLSKYTFSSASTFNWEYTNRDEMPYGMPVAKTCVSLSVATSALNPIKESYKVFQNTPNPFDSETFIAFTIPKSTKVKLRVFDSSGKTLFEQIGDYEAGTHQMRIEESAALLGASQTLYYQMSTQDFISRTFKMNRVKR